MDVATALLAGLFSLGFTSLGVFLYIPRLQARIFTELNAYLETLVKDLTENPDKYAKLMMPVLSKAANEIGGQMLAKLGGGLGEGAQGGEGGSMGFLNMVPKQYRGIVSVMMALKGGFGKGGSNQTPTGEGKFK